MCMRERERERQIKKIKDTHNWYRIVVLPALSNPTIITLCSVKKKKRKTMYIYRKQLEKKTALSYKKRKNKGKKETVSVPLIGTKPSPSTLMPTSGKEGILSCELLNDLTSASAT